MKRFWLSPAVLLGVVLFLSSGCTGHGDGARGGLSANGGPAKPGSGVYTYEELRRLGWKHFDELAPDDQRFLERVLGEELEELKGKGLLVKKSRRSTTIPIYPGAE